MKEYGVLLPHFGRYCTTERMRKAGPLIEGLGFDSVLFATTSSTQRTATKIRTPRSLTPLSSFQASPARPIG